jgi:hypothetical protein
MAIDAGVPQSRRALLAGALGGVVALAAQAIGRPLPALAGADGDVVLGEFNNANSATVIQAPNMALEVLGISPAIHGATIEAEDYVGAPPVGVWGQSTFGTGVMGSSMDYVGVRGMSQGWTGVYGWAGSSVNPPAPNSRTGVYGRADSDASSCGVSGYSTTGAGLYGATSSGYALRTSGRLKLGKASGVAYLKRGTTRVTVTPGLNVTASSFVLLTPKANVGSRRLWYTTNTTANTFTIRISSAMSGTLAIGWLMLEK